MTPLDHLRRSDAGRKAAVVLAALTCMAAFFVLAARAEDEGKVERNIYIPATISPEAQQILKNLSKEKIYEGELPEPDDREGWRKAHAKGESSDKEDEEAVKGAASPSLKPPLAVCLSWISAPGTGKTTARYWSTLTAEPSRCSASTAPWIVLSL